MTSHLLVLINDECILECKYFFIQRSHLFTERCLDSCLRIDINYSINDEFIKLHLILHKRKITVFYTTTF